MAITTFTRKISFTFPLKIQKWNHRIDVSTVDLAPNSSYKKTVPQSIVLQNFYILYLYFNVIFPFLKTFLIKKLTSTYLMLSDQVPIHWQAQRIMYFTTNKKMENASEFCCRSSTFYQSPFKMKISAFLIVMGGCP